MNKIELKIEALLAETRHLKSVTASWPPVLELSLSNLPSKLKKSMSERDALLDRFCKLFPNVVFIQNEKICRGKLTASQNWKSAVNVSQTDLTEGGWILVLNDSDSVVEASYFLGAGMCEKQLLDALSRTGARVAVSSYFDDIEWLIVAALD